MARWKDWAQLVRVPNTLTASADALAGFSLTAGVWEFADAGPLVIISIASICLYWAGMVLNDVNDVEKDRRDRRNGPLVDDRIPHAVAFRFGWSLIAIGVMLAFVAGVWVRGVAVASPEGISDPTFQTIWTVAPALTSILLAIFIVAYDSPLKKSWAGPWLMGLCRATNLSMGIALGLASTNAPESVLAQLGGASAIIPIGHGLFVVGLTLAARKESMLLQSRNHLIRGWGLSVVGVILIAIASMAVQERSRLQLSAERLYPILVGTLALPWLNRAWRSIQLRTVPSLVAAIKQAIITILFLDAAVALQFGGHTAGILVCLLAIPTFALGRWFRMT